MLQYLITFFILAIIAAFLGFGGLAADFAYVARILAGLFVILFIGTLVYSLLTGKQANLPRL